jgi:hypothetical protein
MTVGGDEREIKYPLSPIVTLSAALPPSPNSKEWKLFCWLFGGWIRKFWTRYEHLVTHLSLCIVSPLYYNIS